MSDEYVFEDDGYGYEDNGGDGEGEEESNEPEWEQSVRSNYEHAKRVQAENKQQAIELFQKCIALDEAHGRWTFKSHKSLYRVCLMHKVEDEMLVHYQHALDADYTERTRADVDKMIDKISNRSTHLSAGCRRRIAEQSRNYITKKYNAADEKVGDKMWFNLTQRLAQFAVDDKRVDDLDALIKEMYRWCGTGKEAEARRGTQLTSIYAFHIQLCTELDNPKELRSLYQKATSIESAVAPPKVLGVIHESGGKMFLRQRQWTPAFNALGNAFRNYDLAGDARKLSCLQYLVVAAMLSESAMNPFDMPEARSYQGEPEIVVMTQLFEVAGTSKSLAKTSAAGGAPATGGAAASAGGGAPAAGAGGNKRDVKRFIDILNDPKRSVYLTRDAFLYSLIEPLIQRVRGVGLIELVRPYTAIKLSFIAHALATTPADAEKLAARLILEGRLQGEIDQVKGHLFLGASLGSAGAADSGAGSGGGAGGKKDGKGDDEEEGDNAGTSRAVLLQQLLDSSALLRNSVLSQMRRY